MYHCLSVLTVGRRESSCCQIYILLDSVLLSWGFFTIYRGRPGVHGCIVTGFNTSQYVVIPPGTLSHISYRRFGRSRRQSLSVRSRKFYCGNPTGEEGMWWARDYIIRVYPSVLGSLHVLLHSHTDLVCLTYLQLERDV